MTNFYSFHKSQNIANSLQSPNTTEQKHANCQSSTPQVTIAEKRMATLEVTVRGLPDTALLIVAVLQLQKKRLQSAKCQRSGV